MSIKYHAHFKLQAGSPGPTTEYFGVIELSRPLSGGGAKSAAVVLAKNFECESKDISVLHWSRLH